MGLWTWFLAGSTGVTLVGGALIISGTLPMSTITAAAMKAATYAGFIGGGIKYSMSCMASKMCSTTVQCTKTAVNCVKASSSYVSNYISSSASNSLPSIPSCNSKPYNLVWKYFFSNKELDEDNHHFSWGTPSFYFGNIKGVKISPIPTPELSSPMLFILSILYGFGIVGLVQQGNEDNQFRRTVGNNEIEMAFMNNMEEAQQFAQARQAMNQENPQSSGNTRIARYVPVVARTF